MSRKKNIFFKGILPLLGAFIGAFVFFVIYNHYLLDKTLANLKISLEKLQEIQDPEAAKTIKSILDDTFIMEVARAEADAIILAKIEFSTQIITTMTDKAQLEDALYFIRDIIKNKEEAQSPFANALGNVLTNLNPSEREANIKEVKKKIEKVKKELILYQGRELQEKYLELARFHLLCKEWDESTFYLDKILEVDPDAFVAKKARFYLGLVHKFKGNYEQARDIFRQVKDELPGELGALSYFEEGDSLYRMGRITEAVKVFQQAFKKNPSLEVSQIAQFRAGYIKIYELGGVDIFDEAFNRIPYVDISKSARFGPEDMASFYDLRERGAYDIFKEIVDQVPDSELIPEIARIYRNRGFKLIKQGFSLLKKGRHTLASRYLVAAEEQFNLALEIAPKDALSRSGRGVALYFLKKNESALKEVKAAKQLSPDNPTAVSNLGFAYGGLGMIDEAIQEYKEAMKISPKSAILNYNLGTLYILKDEYSRAREHFRKAKQDNPKLASIYNNVGYVFWREKKYKEAKLEFEKGISLKRDYIESHYNLGVTFYNFEKYKEAKKEFDIVKKLHPAYKQTEWFLSSIHRKGR